MTRTEKEQMVAVLKEKFEESNSLYIVDSSALTVEVINELRGKCYEHNIEMKVVKNTLAIKAMEQLADDKGFNEMFGALKGPSTILFTEVANAPAKLIREFRKVHPKPILKAAYIDTAVYLGDEMLDTLASLKSKEELVGDIILLLQSPAKNVLGALQSGGSKLAGIVKTLQERA